MGPTSACMRSISDAALMELPPFNKQGVGLSPTPFGTKPNGSPMIAAPDGVRQGPDRTQTPVCVTLPLTRPNGTATQTGAEPISCPGASDVDPVPADPSRRS